LKKRAGSPSARSKSVRIVMSALALGTFFAGCRTRTNNESGDVKFFGPFKRTPSPPSFDKDVTHILACSPEWPLAETIVAKAPTRVYHWTNSREAIEKPYTYLSKLVQYGRAANDMSDNPEGAVGGGLYGALDPFVSRDYGNILVSFEIKQGSRFASSLKTGRDRALKAYNKHHRCPGIVYEFEESFVTESRRAIALWDLSSVDPASVQVAYFGPPPPPEAPEMPKDVEMPKGVEMPNFVGKDHLSREKKGEGHPLVQMQSVWEYRNDPNPTILNAIVFSKILDDSSSCFGIELKKLSVVDATTATRWLERFFINQTVGGVPAAEWCAKNAENKDFKLLFNRSNPPSLDSVTAAVANACVPASAKTSSLRSSVTCADAVERVSTLKPSPERVETELKIIRTKHSSLTDFWSKQPSLKDW